MIELQVQKQDVETNAKKSKANNGELTIQSKNKDVMFRSSTDNDSLNNSGCESDFGPPCQEKVDAQLHGKNLSQSMPTSENETDSNNDIQDEKPLNGVSKSRANSADLSSAQPSKSMHIQRMFLLDTTTPQNI